MGDVQRSRLDRDQGWFASQTIEVLGEYSRKPSRLPAVFVYRLSDVEDDRSELGDRFGYENVTATDFDQKFGVRMKEEVELAIWAHRIQRCAMPSTAL